MKFRTDLKNYVLIFIIGIVFFVPYLGLVHLFDWDELNFAEAAREMLVTGDYLTVRIDYEPFHEKPPLFFWLQAGSMKVFGVNEFASRLPNAIIGIISLFVVYWIGKKLFDDRFGILWILVYIGSFLPHFYFKTGIIDPTFNLFIFLGIYYISRYFYDQNSGDANNKLKFKQIAVAALFTGLAVMTKGPVGYLLSALCWISFYLINRKKVIFGLKYFAIYSIVSFIPFIIWYCFLYALYGKLIIEQFINYQLRLLLTSDAGHGQPFYYHIVVLFFGCFPATILLLRSFLKRQTDTGEQNFFKQWSFILLSVVLVVFSIVNTKIVHYSSLAYFPITFLAAYSAYHLLYLDLKWKKTGTWLIAILGILYSMIIFLLPLSLKNQWFTELVHDRFTKDILSINAGWTGFEVIVGLLYFILIITSIYYFWKNNILRGLIFLFGGSAITIFLALPLIAPKIDNYTEATAVSFFESLQNKDCYLQVLNIPNYKYGYLFYSKRSFNHSAAGKMIDKNKFENWLLDGNIDHDAYFISRSQDASNYLLKFPSLKKLYSKNGFVFFIRLKT